MKKWIISYFSFSKREFNGLMVLIALILLVMIFPHFYRLIKPVQTITEAEELAVLKMALEDERRVSKNVTYSEDRVIPLKKKVERFNFDPNTIDQFGWEKLGLSAKQAQSILKYISKGGRFSKPEDLGKMYTISDQVYRELAPYVVIPTDRKDDTHRRIMSQTKGPFVKSSLVIVEINGADTIELDKIKGIGFVFANRIVKYRDRIGGFYDKAQLMEVFGVDSIKFHEIKDQVVVDATKLKKINVNTVEFDELKNHPYIRYKQLNALIQYRKQHGNYSNIADLNKVAILNQEMILRLSPYLEF